MIALFRRCIPVVMLYAAACLPLVAGEGRPGREKEKFEKAIAATTRALEEAPDDPVFLATRGRLYLGLEDFWMARRDLQKAARLEPDAPPLFLELGDALARGGELNAALVAWDEAASAPPPSRERYLHAIRGMAKYGKYGSALLLAEIARVDFPHDFTIALVTANLYGLRNNVPEAAALYDEILEAHPDDGETLANAALLSLSRGDRERASALLARAPRYGGRSLVNLARGREHLADGRHDDAIASFQEALKGDLALPRRYEALYSLGTAFAASGRLDEAIASMEQAVAPDPNTGIRFEDASAWSQLGLLRYMNKNYTAAEEALLRCFAIDEKGSENDYLILGLVRYRGKRYDEALATLDAGLGQYPGNVYMMYNKAEALLDSGRRGEARELFAAVAGHPGGEDFDEVIEKARKHLAAMRDEE